MKPTSYWGPTTIFVGVIALIIFTLFGSFAQVDPIDFALLGRLGLACAVFSLGFGVYYVWGIDFFSKEVPSRIMRVVSIIGVFVHFAMYMWATWQISLVANAVGSDQNVILFFVFSLSAGVVISCLLVFKGLVITTFKLK